MPETVTSLGSLLLLGLLLGFRHATDADHVIAIATIVSRQRTLRGSALIGAAWGVGHTLTILAVGGAIILFGVVIPPRLGLAMELAVGGMLVLLGVLTLTGMGRVIRTAATPYAGGLAPALTHAHAHGPHSHDHPHAHGDYVHRHPHGQGDREHGHGEDQTPLAALDAKLGGLAPTSGCVRWWSASSTGSRARRPSPCSCSRSSGTPSGAWSTCCCSAPAPSAG